MKSEQLTSEKLVKCWICEQPHSGDVCPTCGPPEPWGQTPDELQRIGEQMAKQEPVYFFTNHPDIDE